MTSITRKHVLHSFLILGYLSFWLNFGHIWCNKQPNNLKEIGNQKKKYIVKDSIIQTIKIDRKINKNK